MDFSVDFSMEYCIEYSIENIIDYRADYDWSIWLVGWLILIGRPVDWLFAQLRVWLFGRLVVRVIFFYIIFECAVVWGTYLFMDWFIDWLVELLLDRLPDWYLDRVMDYLVYFLFGYLVTFDGLIGFASPVAFFIGFTGPGPPLNCSFITPARTHKSTQHVVKYIRVYIWF